jgi:hypothetical protein
VATVGALAAAALAGGGPASAAGKPGLATGRVTPGAAALPPPSDGYQFIELGSHKNRLYNQLNGINNHGRIVGGNGSGSGGQAIKGYTINPPYAQGDITAENFPKSAQTAVEGINDTNVLVGYYSTQNKKTGTNNSFGWYYNGKYHEVVYPTGSNAKPTQDELNGVNNHDVAVGAYLNSAGRERSYTYNIKTGKFALVTKPGAPTGGSAPSLEAFGINNRGDVAGEYTPASGHTEDGFIKLASGAFHTIAVPGAVETVAVGVNDNDTVVGAYINASGSSAGVHGFIWRIGGNLTMFDDPNAHGTTVLFGINDEGDIVGYYIDSNDHIDGLLALPPF